MTQELADFLREIKQWMCNNDYECGPVGSEIYDKINEHLVNNGHKEWEEDE